MSGGRNGDHTLGQLGCDPPAPVLVRTDQRHRIGPLGREDARLGRRVRHVAAVTEKTAARKWGYVFTPTIVFLPDELPEDGTVADSAVATMPGSFGKWTFLNMFRWVNEKGYESDEHFQKYHARIINELRDQGRLGGD